MASVGVLAMVGRHGAVDAQHDAGILHPQERIVGARRLARGGHGVSGHAEEDGGVGLHDGAVEQPRVARANPA